MSAILTLFNSLIIRLWGGLCGPLFFLFFCIPFGKKKMRKGSVLWLWLWSSVIGIGGWRILWLASSGGRSDRYYVLFSLIVILWVSWGIRGMCNFLFRLGPCRRYCSARLLFGILLLVCGIINIGKALHSGKAKSFLWNVAEQVNLQAQRTPEARLLLWDATSEVARLKNIITAGQADILEFPRWTLSAREKWEKDLHNKLLCNQKYSYVFLLVRYRASEHFALPLYVNAEKLGIYPYRNYIYELYQLNVL